MLLSSLLAAATEMRSLFLNSYKLTSIINMQIHLPTLLPQQPLPIGTIGSTTGHGTQ